MVQREVQGMTGTRRLFSVDRRHGGKTRKYQKAGSGGIAASLPYLLENAYNLLGFVSGIIVTVGGFGTVYSDLEAGAPSLYKLKIALEISRILLGWISTSIAQHSNKITDPCYQDKHFRGALRVAASESDARPKRSDTPGEVERSPPAYHFFPNGTFVVLEFDK
jgi:hypothetical protein